MNKEQLSEIISQVLADNGGAAAASATSDNLFDKHKMERAIDAALPRLMNLKWV